LAATDTGTLHVLETRRLRGEPPHALARPWKTNRLERSQALVGKTVKLEHGADTFLTYSFEPDSLTWDFSGGVVPKGSGSAPYDAVEARDSVFFVEYVDVAGNTAVSLILDVEGGCALLARNVIVDLDGNPIPAGADADWRQLELRQEIVTARIDGSDGSAPLPHLTADLVGKRWYAEYAPDIIAEHVYMNPRRIAWQGLGDDKYDSGAECDVSSLWKMRPSGLYVLTWVEDFQPVGAVLLMDYENLRNTGGLFGVDDEGIVHELCGARLGFLSDTEYPKGYEPAHW
jgi:MoaF C-terminal domain/MoaF N-terminal domain